MLLTQMMGFVNIRDWTWTCSQDTGFSYLSSPQSMCYSSLTKAQPKVRCLFY